MATKTQDVNRTDDERAPREAAAAGADTANGTDGTTGPSGKPAGNGEETRGTEGAPETGERAEAGGPGGSEEADALTEEPAERTPSGVGLGAGAVVSAGLGLVSLTGGWIGTVAAARETLVGQLQTSSGASVGKQLKEVYGDAWHTTALWAGLFALAALITGVVVLVRPAFGAPGRPQAAWIRSVAWAGVSLGVIGLLLAVLKYSDALLGLPATG
ncbi:hypothetical protein NHG22_06010 [Streptomyces sp. ATE26]|uniref:hypothetical protein n=1 Tax=Streptomyces sp. ATE26 TaxID=2954237 RepID=UPI0024825F59|nr:hypothetical protein [Streptomyces sp. ATE26]MDI1453368.1 hypothetical protein [Streptomyces sp. ATE26]